MINQNLKIKWEIKMRNWRRFILALFVLSGISALIYELILGKKFEYIVGTTSLAIALVLSSFFAGLALGSFIFGRLAERKNLRQRLVIYALVEAAIGLWAIILPSLLELVSQVQSATFSAILAYIVLLILASLIGATWPLFQGVYLTSHQDLQRQLAKSYGWNTFGGLVGILAVLFILAVKLGLNGSIYLAAGLNLTIAFCLYMVAQKVRGEVAQFTQESLPGQKLILILFFLTGFGTLSLKVSWTRLLILSMGSSIYAFGLILLVFLLGIALGSWFLGKYQFNKSPWLAMGGILFILFLWIFISFSWLDNLPDLYVKLTSSSFSSALWGQFWLAFIIILPATLLMGALFPLGLKLYSHGQVKGLGDLYSVNTLGGIGGPLLMTLIIIPAIGLEKSLKAIALGYLLLGLIAVIVGLRIWWQRGVAMGVVLALIIAMIFLPGWREEILVKGGYIYRESALARQGKLLFYEDGKTATISVGEKDNEIYLSINGKADASTGSDLATELLLGHLPMLFAPDNNKALVIGLGSGITVGAVSLYSNNIDVAEVEGAVVEANQFFAPYNRDILKNPNVHIHIADGRHFLTKQDKKYDAITSKPSNPWVAGESNLFTQEFFQIAKDHLTDNGVMAQWIHLYNMGPENLAMIFQTFQSVFDKNEVWYAPTSDLILLGFKGEKAEEKKITERIKEKDINADLEKLGISDAKTLEDYLISSNVKVENNLIHRDNFPYLEYSAPKYLGQETRGQNLEKIKAMIDKDSDNFKHLLFDGIIAFSKGDINQGINLMEQAINLRSKNPWIAKIAAMAIAQINSSLAQVQNQYNLPAMEKALSWDPENMVLLQSLAFYYLSNNIIDRAQALALKSIQLYPNDDKGHALLGILNLQKNDSSQAEEQFLKALEINPENFLAYNGLGQIYL